MCWQGIWSGFADQRATYHCETASSAGCVCASLQRVARGSLLQQVLGIMAFPWEDRLFQQEILWMVEEILHQLIDGKHPIILCFQPFFWWWISQPPYFWPLAMNDMNKIRTNQLSCVCCILLPGNHFIAGTNICGRSDEVECPHSLGPKGCAEFVFHRGLASPSSTRSFHWLYPVYPHGSWS